MAAQNGFGMQIVGCGPGRAEMCGRAFALVGSSNEVPRNFIDVGHFGHPLAVKAVNIFSKRGLERSRLLCGGKTTQIKGL